MKYIVLYSITFFLITLSDAAGQKTAIDLLPSTSGQVHPEAVIDTCYTNDSLVRIMPGDLNTSRPKEEIKEDSVRRIKEVEKNRSKNKAGKHPLIFKITNPLRFFIQVTALKK